VAPVVLQPSIHQDKTMTLVKQAYLNHLKIVISHCWSWLVCGKLATC